MTDLIDREKLLEIYKNWIPQLSSKEDEGDRRGVETCIAVLEDAKAVDAVPVVRCLHCKYKRITNGSMKVKSYSCDRSSSPCRGRIVEPSFFCPYGEKEKIHDR